MARNEIGGCAGRHYTSSVLPIALWKNLKALVDAKRKEGLDDTEIFKVLARPGYSQHHTGRALDLHPASALLEEDFETTDAFRWLTQYAHLYGFELSYPRENPYGIIYEPWHWFYLR